MASVFDEDRHSGQIEPSLSPRLLDPPRLRAYAGGMHFRSAVLALAAIAVAAHGQEWTRFRGPNGSGIGKADLPEQLTEKNVHWRCKLPGSGHSSPVLWGGRIFVTATTDVSMADNARRSVVCVNAADGKILWQKEYATGGFRHHADNSFASPSCTVDAERVYAWFPGRDASVLVALSQEDGAEIWKRDLGPFKSQHGAGASPVVEAGLVILQSSQDAPGSFIEAFDPKAGKTVWKAELKGGQHSMATPCLVPGAGGKPQLLSLTTDSGLLGLDPATGKQLWAMPDIFHFRVVASPVVMGGGLILTQSGKGQAGSEITVVKGAAESKPEKAYEVVRTGGYVPTPIAVGDLVFLWKENGLVTCLRAATNEQLWSERVEGPFFASPVCIGGKGGRIYNVTRAGDLVAIAADEKFRLIQRFPLGEKNSYATPAIGGGRLFVRTFTQLVAIGK